MRGIVEGALRAKLYGPDGTVTYVTEHGSVNGTSRKNLPGVLVEVQATEVGSLNGEGGLGVDQKALEAYVPMSFFDGQYPRGVPAVDPYAPVAAAARAEYVPVAIVLGSACWLLICCYFQCCAGSPGVGRSTSARFAISRCTQPHTGLPNRDLFRDRLQQVILLERREAGRAAALLYPYLDRFKEINDTLGHQRGDDVLEQAGQSLAVVRERHRGPPRWRRVRDRVPAHGCCRSADARRSCACHWAVR